MEASVNRYNVQFDQFLLCACEVNRLFRVVCYQCLQFCITYNAYCIIHLWFAWMFFLKRPDFSDSRCKQNDRWTSSKRTSWAFRIPCWYNEGLPRIHCNEGACLILHSMDRHRFIARTVQGYPQDPIWDVAHNFKMEIACYRLLIIDDSEDRTEPKSSVLFSWNAPVAFTEYSTEDRNIGEIKYGGRMRHEIGNTKPINVRFEYFGNRFKRFALVVGPPHMRTSHIPDSKQLSHITDLFHDRLVYSRLAV